MEDNTPQLPPDEVKNSDKDEVRYLDGKELLETLQELFKPNIRCELCDGDAFELVPHYRNGAMPALTSYLPVERRLPGTVTSPLYLTYYGLICTKCGNTKLLDAARLSAIVASKTAKPADSDQNKS